MYKRQLPILSVASIVGFVTVIGFAIRSGLILLNRYRACLLYTSGNFQVAALLLEKGADMTAGNKFGKNALQLAEEGALAYQSSFDLTKTEVSKAPVDSFIRAYEKAVAGLPPEHAPEFMEAMKKAVGRQSFVETGYFLQLITRSLSSKNRLTEEQSGKFREEITGAIAENSRIIDVRGVAFEHTVDLLRKAAERCV